MNETIKNNVVFLINFKDNYIIYLNFIIEKSIVFSFSKQVQFKQQPVMQS